MTTTLLHRCQRHALAHTLARLSLTTPSPHHCNHMHTTTVTLAAQATKTATSQQQQSTKQGTKLTTTNQQPLTAAQQSTTYSILNHPFPPTRAIGVSLRQIYGIGYTVSDHVCADLGLNPYSTPSDIGLARFEHIKRTIEKQYQPRHIAVKSQQQYVVSKVRLGTYQGIRHQLALPVHGQRTRSNAKTQRKLGRQRAALFGYQLLAKKAQQVNRLQQTTKQLQAGKEKRK